MWPLLPIHWGLVNRTLNISGVEPRSKILEPVKGEDSVSALTGRGLIKKVAGIGSVKGLKGSGITKKVGGRAKLCP